MFLYKIIIHLAKQKKKLIENRINYVWNKNVIIDNISIK